MSEQVIIKADDVKSMSTKFYYKNKKLCFRILIKLKDENNIFYQDFACYRDYRSYHDKLINSLKKHNDINEYMDILNKVRDYAKPPVMFTS